MNDTAIKEFWVGFRDASYFVRHFLKSDYQHVYILYKDGGKWIELNPRNHALEAFILPYDPKKVDVPALIHKDHGHPFLRLKIEQRGRKQPNLNIFRTIHCVNVVKYILGIRVWALTPYQLYKRLSKMPSHIMAKKGILEIDIL